MKVPSEALREILALPEGPERARLLDACSLYEELAPEEEDVLYRLGVALAAGRDPKALVMAELLGRAKPWKNDRSSG